MQVSLKKGAALALALSAVPVKLDHSYNIDVFGAAPTQSDLDIMNNLLLVQVAEAMKLNECVYVIRSLIGKANEGKINELLTERAMIDKALAVLGTLPLRDVSPNLTALAAKMAATKESLGTSSGYGRTPAVTLELLTEPYGKNFAKPLKKRRLKLEDKLAHLNFTTMIELPDDVVKVLTAYDLI